MKQKVGFSWDFVEQSLETMLTVAVLGPLRKVPHGFSNAHSPVLGQRQHILCGVQILSNSPALIGFKRWLITHTGNPNSE